ncbi:hypothetical protein N7491_000436 [Penicillium cf. griseofulvum]|uniref:Uncharacterized protein n=1 Tax=Penicillium cf. griseofulvum TaxID=2972120 RepID=A0A9W9ME06_9EURO|nr:hypothetical protein N7472_004204 [Penicillium cf. griseofulvum]KAJ5451254.1 hypothetical protein N7491_000436 [Penicillium cf. griseofulvum]
MSVMLDTTSSRLFQTTRNEFQAKCQQLIDDILHNGLSFEDELNDRVGQLHRSLGQLTRAGQMMAIDCPTNELVRVVPAGFFTVLIDRPGQNSMSEFDWACIYTADTLNMLTGDSMRHRTPAEVACNLETQSFLWDLVVPFPSTISQAEHPAPPPYVNALRIPRPASFARTHSRIPVGPRPPPPVDTYLAYNRPVPCPYTPALPPRPVDEFEPDSEPESPPDASIMGLYRNPSIQFR